MKSIRFVFAALTAVVTITCLAQSAPAFADNSDNRRHADTDRSVSVGVTGPDADTDNPTAEDRQ